MSRHDTGKPSLDTILDAIRTEEPSHQEVSDAARRIGAQLGLSTEGTSSAVHIESCSGFQALIPAYLRGELPRETALLLEDHSRECIPCRRVLIAARTPKPAGATGAVPETPRAFRARWAAAAALAAIAVLGTYAAWQIAPFLGADPQLKVLRADGSLFQVRDGVPRPLTPGMTIPASDIVRTARDSGALLMMDDGSRIEMRERTGLAVSKRRNGSTVRLQGGSIIVEASPQGSGHLDVRTDDCLVAVKGTIFSVNNGTKGSRVSVVEGAVRVAADGRESVLSPGDQMTTSDAVTRVAVRDEIAWSKDADRYDALLRELASLRQDLDARIPNSRLRYGSKLLDGMPPDTIVYAAIPNLTAALVEAKRVFEEHVAQSEALQAWWDEHMSDADHRREMDEAFERVRALGTQLGDEIVISFASDGAGGVRGPMVTAEVNDIAALRRVLVSEFKEMRHEVSVSFENGVIHFEPAAPPRTASPRAASSGAAPWVGSPFHRLLEGAYADGTAWLFGADLKSIVASAVRQAQEQGDSGERVTRQWEKMGVLDAQYAIFERTEGPDGADHRLEVAFDQPRRGVAGWLAEPAPMGAAEFVSPDASFAMAAVVKRPEALLTEALSWVEPDGVDIQQHFDQIRAETGVDPLHDVAGVFGGDVAVALDGPLLPVPSWRLVIEVYDAAALQVAIEKLVGWVNDRLAAEGRPERLLVERETGGNRFDWVVRFTGAQSGGIPVRYTFSDGYLIAAPSRVLIERAIEQRAGGYALTRSKAFTELLPVDGQVNVSSFVWQHLGPAMGPISRTLASALSPAERGALEAELAVSRPRLLTISAEADRIVVGSRGEAGVGSLLGSLVSAQGLAALSETLDARDADPAGGIAPR